MCYCVQNRAPNYDNNSDHFEEENDVPKKTVVTQSCSYIWICHKGF